MKREVKKGTKKSVTVGFQLRTAFDVQCKAWRLGGEPSLVIRAPWDNFAITLKFRGTCGSEKMPLSRIVYITSQYRTQQRMRSQPTILNPTSEIIFIELANTDRKADHPLII